MKLSVAIAGALIGLATALNNADVYIFRQAPSSPGQPESPPQLPRQLARLILQQRLGVDDYFSSLEELSSLPDADEAVSHINAYGRPEAPLFAAGGGSDGASQLLIILEGMEDWQMGRVVTDIPRAFGIDEAPSSAATNKLVDVEFAQVGAKFCWCSRFSRAIDPHDEDCWTGGKSSILRYDVKTQDYKMIESIHEAQSQFAALAEAGVMETTILLLPESAREPKADSWSFHPAQLHRRQSETVLSAADPLADQAGGPLHRAQATDEVFPGTAVDVRSIPACFKSLNSCMTATADCSGHGLCVDRWAPQDGQGREDRASCFACKCQKSEREGHAPTHWSGAVCEKVDVSTPFALFFGFTILSLVIVSVAIGLLFSIGQDPLPGVLGAGVSKK